MLFSTRWHPGASVETAPWRQKPALPWRGSPFQAGSRSWKNLRRATPVQEDVNSWRTPEFNPVPGSQDAAAAAATTAEAGAAEALGAPAPCSAPSPARERAQLQKKKSKSFEERYRELTLFYMEHGHCAVPVSSGLGGWVAYQRRLWKSGSLPQEHYHQLAALGFQFDAFSARWASRFRQLAEFHSLYGHCVVPPGAAAEARWPGLRQWTILQRQAWKRGLLSDDRVRRLSGLGFVWQPAEARWEERFAELQAFKQEHGHCNVPKGWIHNQGLASWVERLRRDWRARQGVRAISHSREARLRELGFDFEPQLRPWEERYAQLREVLAGEGHLAGPFPSRGRFAGLAEWVVQQRFRGRAGRLHPDRKQALDALGFVWDPDDCAWVRHLATLDALLAEAGGPRAVQALLEGQTPGASRVLTVSSSSSPGAQEGIPSNGSRHPPAAAQRLRAVAARQGKRREPAAQVAAPGWQRGLDAAREGGSSSSQGQPEQLRASQRLAELVRWYRGVRRQAAAGVLRRERLAQLAERGLHPCGPAS